MKTRNSSLTVAALLLLTVLAGAGAAIPVQAAPATRPFAGYYYLGPDISWPPFATISNSGRISGKYGEWVYPYSSDTSHYPAASPSGSSWTLPYYVEATIRGAISDLGEMQFHLTIEVTTPSWSGDSSTSRDDYDYRATGSLDGEGNLVVTYPSGSTYVWTRQ